MAALPPPGLTPDSMNQYWNAAWSEGRTGWRAFEASKPFEANLAAVSTVIAAELTARGAQKEQATLAEEGNQAAASSRRRVGFVPLCGDTYAVRALLDLGVVDCCLGADLNGPSIDAAVAQHLAQDKTLTLQTTTDESLVVHRLTRAADAKSDATAAATVLVVGYVVGDLFSSAAQNALRQLASEGGSFNSNNYSSSPSAVQFVYDRASMIALPPSLRSEYVKLLKGLLGGAFSRPRPAFSVSLSAGSTEGAATTTEWTLMDGMVFLELVRRPDSDPLQLTTGPPFHIPETTVLELYNGEDGNESPMWKLVSCTTIKPAAGDATPFYFEGYALFR